MIKSYFMYLSFFIIFGAPTIASAQACLKLSGTYKCEDSSATRHLTFTTTVKNQVHHYSLNSLKIAADGIPSTRSNGAGGSLVYTAHCSEDALTIKVETDIMSGFCAYPVSIESETTWFQTAEGLFEDDLTIIQCPGKTPQHVRKQTNCAKIRGLHE